MAVKPTQVYITVDVECCEERQRGGQWQPAMGYDLRVWGRLSNQRRALGISLIMEELEKFDLRGVFYVEALGAHSFGTDGLREVCQTILQRGHDVQLHLHPLLRDANWHSNGHEPVDDNISAYSVEDQVRLLGEGIDLLVKAGVPRDRLRSYRAGNFGASNDIWSAMEQAGLCLSSNYNPGYFHQQCSMRLPNAGTDLFASPVAGVWELPVSNLLQPNGTHRHLQITAVSLEEIKLALCQSRMLGIGHVTLVTHSFEFFHIDSPAEKKGHLNYLNLHRLRGLARFLHDHRDDFSVDTAGDLAERLRSDPHIDLPHPTPVKEYPREKHRHYYRRLAEQALKRVGARVTVL